MNSIEHRMRKIQRENPNWSSYLSFAESIKSRNYSKRIIAKWFNKLVEKEEYSSKDKKDILKFLGSL